MPNESEIQAAVNAITSGLELLSGIDWGKYCTDGPGMHSGVVIAQSLAAQAGMIQSVSCDVLEPLGILALTLDNALKGTK